MDLTRLRWTKNMKHQGKEKWAYQHIPTIYPEFPELKIFTLAWRNLENRDEDNAKEPLKDDLIILRQHGKVTHIVKLLNDDLYCDKNLDPDEFNIHRLVQAIWITPDWNNPPDNDEVFDFHINLQGGKVIKLQNIKAFQQRWNKEELSGFQQHVENIIEKYEV